MLYRRSLMDTETTNNVKGCVQQCGLLASASQRLSGIWTHRKCCDLYSVEDTDTHNKKCLRDRSPWHSHVSSSVFTRMRRMDDDPNDDGPTDVLDSFKRIHFLLAKLY